MSLAGLLQCLTRAMELAAESASHARWYGFGSFFSDGKCFSDVDLLVVCASPEEGLLIHELCRELWSEWPVDLLILTEAEEAETSFVEKQGCIRLDDSGKRGLIGIIGQR